MALALEMGFAAATVGGLCWLGLLLWQETRRPRVICLMYHRLVSRRQYARLHGTERVFAMPLETLAEQIQWLKSMGYRFLTPEEVVQFAQGRLALPERSVHISFDDGCLSVLTSGLSILQQHGARATLFVTTDPGSQVFPPDDPGQRRMTDEELGRWTAAGFELGSHGVTHKPLHMLPDEELTAELKGSRETLERMLGQPVRHLAIPGNWYDDRVLAEARRCGYGAVWCSRQGAVRRGDPLFGLPRVNMDGDLNLRQFAATISPAGMVGCRVLAAAKRAPKQVLGYARWMKVRVWLLRCVPGGYLSKRRLLLLFGVAIGLGLIGLRWLLRAVR